MQHSVLPTTERGSFKQQIVLNSATYTAGNHNLFLTVMWPIQSH